MKNLVAGADGISPETSKRDQRQTLYQWGSDLWRDKVLIAWAEDIATGTPQERRTTDAWRSLYYLPVNEPVPEFPLQGRDVLDINVEAGPAVGNYLAQVEAWWAAGDFEADRGACLTRLKEVVSAGQ